MSEARGGTTPFAEFGAYLRERRKAAKKTWGQVQIQVGIDKSTISRDENGEIDIPSERLHRYAAVYGVPPEELLGKWFHAKYGINPFAPREISEKNLYSEPQVRFHQMLDLILNRGDKEQVDGIISNLKAFTDQIQFKAGQTLEAYIEAKKASKTEGEEKKREPA